MKVKARAELTVILIAASLSVWACASPPPAGGTETAGETKAAGGTETAVSPAAEESHGENAGALETDDETIGDTSDKENHQAGSETPSSELPEKAPLTVDKILELSGREDLTWEDFQDYPSKDIGSGLLVLRYDVDNHFCLYIGGGGADREPMYIRAASVWDDEAYIDIRNPVQDVEAFFREHAHTDGYVGLRGHVKESRRDEVLISSDTDDFPGIFWVEGIETLTTEGELKGGTPVYVLMEDTGEQADDGLERFRAKEITALSEDGQEGKVDILLESAPELTLTDVLSSRYEPFTIQPGNSSWSVMDGGEVSTVVACGASPADEAGSERAAKLKIPSYNRMDEGYYSFSTTVAPDRLVVRRWDNTDAGKQDSAPECVITYYCPVFTVGLEKGKVYEFAAEWKEEDLEENGFGGRASYVLVTE